jgi:hypothetical protein
VRSGGLGWGLCLASFDTSRALLKGIEPRRATLLRHPGAGEVAAMRGVGHRLLRAADYPGPRQCLQIRLYATPWRRRSGEDGAAASGRTGLLIVHVMVQAGRGVQLKRPSCEKKVHRQGLEPRTR